MKTKMKLIVASMVAMIATLTMAICVSASDGATSITAGAQSAFQSIDLSGILDVIWTILPIALPIVIGIAAFRLGMGVFKGLLRG